MSDIQRVRCIHCLNETAEVTADGLKCIHPHCGKEWSFEHELQNYKRIQKVVGRNIVRPPEKKKNIRNETPLVSRRSVKTADKESEEKTDDN